MFRVKSGQLWAPLAVFKAKGVHRRGSSTMANGEGQHVYLNTNPSRCLSKAKSTDTWNCLHLQLQHDS